jgi:hypothetical protein
MGTRSVAAVEDELVRIPLSPDLTGTWFGDATKPDRLICRSHPSKALAWSLVSRAPTAGERIDDRALKARSQCPITTLHRLHRKISDTNRILANSTSMSC